MGTMDAAGFGAQMASRPGGMILCFTCRNESPAAEFDLQAQRRTEGASDPDDMLAIVGVVCPRCGTKGTAVLGYGPEADPDDSEVSCASASITDAGVGALAETDVAVGAAQ